MVEGEEMKHELPQYCDGKCQDCNREGARIKAGIFSAGLLVGFVMAISMF